jgi:hypothetical protein
MSDRASTASGEAGRSSCRHARCDAGERDEQAGAGRDLGGRSHHRCRCWPQVAPVAPLALTQAKLDQVMRRAVPILPDLRAEYPSRR